MWNVPQYAKMWNGRFKAYNNRSEQLQRCKHIRRPQQSFTLKLIRLTLYEVYIAYLNQVNTGGAQVSIKH